MQSVVSYPNRGNYGKNSWRGNTSGLIIKDLCEHFKPKLFVDICEGSGTSRDVCKELGIDYYGFDLYTGFDFTKNNLISKLPRPVDMAFSHLPYWNMINYKEERDKNKLLSPAGCNDLSLVSLDEFLEMSFQGLMQQREATKDGGIYTTLIGDYRKDGKFYSFQSDYIKMMPNEELKSVVIKVQHNVQSNNKTYANMNFIPIQHEYLLVWQKKHQSIFSIALNKAAEHKKQISMTWRVAIRQALINLGKKAKLEEIYNEVVKLYPGKVTENENYKAKIRQQLQLHFTHVERGVWAA